MNRRTFQRRALGLLAATAGIPAIAATRPLRILILGGTQFIGVHMVREALRRRHSVTLFNRGQTNPALFPDLEKLRGDRDGQLDALRGRQWDCVIDDSGYIPRHVRLSTELLAGNVRQYLFISSVSAYAGFSAPNDESSPLAVLRDPTTEKFSGETYGAFKAVAEEQVRRSFPDRSIVLRPGFVVGPEDRSGRFAWWLANAARGGAFVVPGEPRVAMQWIDARDLARFALDLLEQRHNGTWNVVSPSGRFTMGPFVAACVASARRHAQPLTPPQPVWIPRPFIVQRGINPQGAFPLWVDGPDDPAFARTSGRRALAAGLRITPLNRTVDDTMAWLVATPEARTQALTGGLDANGQNELLTAWQQQEP